MSNGAALVFSTQAFDGTFVGTLSGTGSLTKAGIGIVTLTGDHPMTGSATVQQGGLVLNGTFGGSVDVKPGAAFTAAGAVGGSLSRGRGDDAAASPAASLFATSGLVAVAPQALSTRLAGIADDGRAVGRHRERDPIGAAGVYSTSRSARTVPIRPSRRAAPRRSTAPSST